MLEFQKTQFLDLHFFTTLSDLPVQWCNLTLPWWFWATKVFLLASKISKICLSACPTRRATSWKANFENYSRYSLIKWYNIIQHEQYFFSFQAHFLRSARSSQSDATSCLSLMSHHQVNNKSKELKDGVEDG